MKKTDILIIITLFLIAFLIRIIGVSNVSMYIDEWIYWLRTDQILSNNWVPLAKVFDYSPPFLSYIGAVVTVLFGGDLNTLRLISVVLGSLNVPLLYLFGKAMYDRKTGLLASVFLSFSTYHILYSRVYMLETLTLFFSIAFLYFFWLSQCPEYGPKNTTYAIIAGAMMGLAFDVKYIVAFLIPTIPAYVLWITKFNFKALMDKRIILIFIFAFVFVLPLLFSLLYTGIGFHGILFYAFDRFGNGETSGTVTRTSAFSSAELLERGVGKLVEVFAWGADADILIPSLEILFNLTVFLILLITIYFYFLGLMRKEKKSSFFMISLFMLALLILASGNTQHYLIYSYPFFYIMLSHISVESFDHLKRENNSKNVLKLCVVLFAIMMLFFYFLTALTSFYWDRGDYHPWSKNVVDYIERDIIKNGYEKENVLIGIVMPTTRIVDYQLYLSKSELNKSNIHTFFSVEKISDYSGKPTTINLEMIDILKPTYIIMDESAYKMYFKQDVKIKIFQDYRIVFHSRNYPVGSYIFKRKKIQLPELLQANGKSGEISHDLFERSIPDVMKIGQSYTALIQIINKGDSRRNFTVSLISNEFIIFVEEPKKVTLDKDSTSILKIKIVPFKEHYGKIPISADLYINDKENETKDARNTLREGGNQQGISPIDYKKVDSSTDYVYLITK